jgi:hypothetical protein
VLNEEFTCGYEGSEDWIRDKLAEVVDAKNKYLRFVKQCRSYNVKRKRSGSAKANSTNKEAYEFIEDEDEQV